MNYYPGRSKTSESFHSSSKRINQVPQMLVLFSNRFMRCSCYKLFPDPRMARVTKFFNLLLALFSSLQLFDKCSNLCTIMRRWTR